MQILLREIYLSDIRKTLIAYFCVLRQLCVKPIY